MTGHPNSSSVHWLTESVAVRQSLLYATNTGIVRQGSDVLVIDPGIFAIELDSLADELAPNRVAAGFTTHPHWDHILWSSALGTDVPRFASIDTVGLLGERRERLLGQLDEIERDERVNSRQWDREVLFTERPLNVGANVIGGFAVELVCIDGHCDGQTALVVPEHKVAFVADTLSNVETPSLERRPDAVSRYLASLNRVQRVIDAVDLIVPGHGAPADRAEAQRRLDADRRYLEFVPLRVAEAPSGIADEELARQVLTELKEERVQSDLAWDMHLETVQALRSAASEIV